MNTITLKDTVSADSYSFRGRIVGNAQRDTLYESETGGFYMETRIDEDIIVLVYDDLSELERILLKENNVQYCEDCGDRFSEGEIITMNHILMHN